MDRALDNLNSVVSSPDLYVGLPGVARNCPATRPDGAHVAEIVFVVVAVVVVVMLELVDCEDGRLRRV